MRPDRLCGVLAEPERLRAFAAIVLGAATAQEVAERAGLPARSAGTAVRRLIDGGLVRQDGAGLVAEPEVFKIAVRDATAPSEPAVALDADAKRDSVLRAYLVDGRLVRIPAASGKRRIVLEHMVAAFEPGVRYPEPEVNAVLRAWHDDHAALRRHLVEAGLMNRDHGVYWRIGGPYDV